MKRSPARAQVLMAAMLAIGMTGQPVGADTHHEWTRMQAGANQPGFGSLESQCLGAMATSGWTVEDCTDLRRLAEQGQCNRTLVPDGTRYDSMTGSGQRVSGLTVKQLGGQTPALECTISPTKVAHWYTNFPNACNNLGTNPQRSTPTLRRSQETIVQQSSIGFHFEGLRVCGPCGYKLPDVSFVIPGGVEHHFKYEILE